MPQDTMAHPNDGTPPEDGLRRPETPHIPPKAKPEDQDTLLPQPDTPPVPPASQADDAS